ncbi:MAG: M23 family metallopeptidase [Elusimicrobia bacterium]|nr:M23 family metallopeptidase [Elusimicrobiota bacterium]
MEIGWPRISQGKRWALRGILYSLLAGALLGADRWENRLQAEVASLDQPSPGASLHQGVLGKKRFFDILTATGSSPAEAATLSRALSRVLDMRRLMPEDSFSVMRSSSGRFMHMTLVHGKSRYVLTETAKGLRASKHPLAVSEHLRRASGSVEESLWVAMEAAGVPPEVILEFADVFQWTIDFLTETRKGDRFAVVWTERQAADGRIWDRIVEAGHYKGLAAGDRTGILFEGRYYDKNGDSLNRMFLRAPLKFNRISSGFARRRNHPILRTNRPHHGTDYAAPRGTPVSSVADGRVEQIGRKGGFGNVVKIRHSRTYASLYAHLSRFAARLRPGSPVQQGQVIGYVGSTGLANGPHLHFQMEKDGRWVDFLRIELPSAQSIPRSRRQAFASRLESVLSELNSIGTIASS